MAGFLLFTGSLLIGGHVDGPPSPFPFTPQVARKIGAPPIALLGNFPSPRRARRTALPSHTVNLSSSSTPGPSPAEVQRDEEKKKKKKTPTSTSTPVKGKAPALPSPRSDEGVTTSTPLAVPPVSQSGSSTAPAFPKAPFGADFLAEPGLPPIKPASGLDFRYPGTCSLV